ncbi:DNA polymerase III PolC-type-like [Saccoglossus kowalevskii]|uniref:Uncharacterized protein LOC102809360 n=1 Tax=Saccoglossus kowalevskii TaxID=10224 RepID=A0ABM0LZJ4_SACKO|nr:PREDICTED: uncharacterized protein LOC102809360 [Saccoglossus kowalevskii]
MNKRSTATLRPVSQKLIGLTKSSYRSKSGVATLKTATEPDENSPTFIPPQINKPATVPLPSSDYSRIVFDLETTSLGDNADIVQLAAIHDKDVFNCYILPKKKMTKDASKLTKIYVRRYKVYHNRKVVPSTNLLRALERFCKWLSKYRNPLLVAHNAKRFDSRVIVQQADSVGYLPKLQQFIAGFVDSLPLFKLMCPDMTSYTQEHLVKEILHQSYDAHNAVGDVRSLSDLISHLHPTVEHLISHSFSVSDVITYLKYSATKKKNLSSLQKLVSNNILSQYMIERIAGSGLNFRHLLLCYKRGGQDGLVELFQEKINGEVRVTEKTTIVAKLADHLNGYNLELL